MKTLYEVLEVSENASNEIIEKAYKVLAKKYHPDLWPQDKKKYAEQKMKEINEAYDVLSNEIKRKEYNSTLEIERQKQMELKMQEELKRQEKINMQDESMHNNNSEIKQKNYTPNDEEYLRKQEEYLKEQENYRKAQEEIRKNMQADYEQKYQNAYENYLRRLGYKIKYKWTWKEYKNLIISILIIIAIGAILWFFPITHNWIIEFYNSNPIIKTIIDIIGSVFVGIWNAITSIFKK